MLTCRDIDDGFGIDFECSQLEPDELEDYMMRQAMYLKEDHAQKMKRHHQPATYFPSLISEVGPYKPVATASINDIERERNRRKIIDRKLGKR